MSSNHWAANLFQQPVLSVKPIKRTTHQVEIVKLADNTLWVVKQYANSTWLGFTNYNDLLLGQTLANIAVSLPNITAQVFTIDNHFVTINPYYLGKTKAITTSQQAYLLGQKLAQLHAINYKIQTAKPLPSIIWPANEHSPGWLNAIINVCNKTHDLTDWVVSHRDLHQGNIIWQNSNQVQFIDWESAGLIHPGIELIGLACNCAGISKFAINDLLFKATLAGYVKVAGTLPVIDMERWPLIFHSWLLWYVYAVQQNQSSAALAALNIIKLLRQKLNMLKELYVC